MKLYIKNEEYEVIDKPSLTDPVTFHLATQPSDDLGDILSLKDNNGFLLCDIRVSDYKYWTVMGSIVSGTNYKSEDPGPGPEPPPMPTYDDMAAAIKEGVDGV